MFVRQPWIFAALLVLAACGSESVTVESNNGSDVGNDATTMSDATTAPGDAGDSDAGIPSTYDGPSCLVDVMGTVCGGDLIANSDPDTLYTCDGAGPAGLGQPCGAGCVAEAEGDHRCEQDVAICDTDAKTGYYCVGDKVTGGAEGTLYFCDGPGMATPSEVCAGGCVVAHAGYDDHCAATGASCDADARTGFYCAGDKVSGGEPGTLYRCAGPGDASLAETCANGCVVAPAGSDDYCRAAVTCDADASTGFYCSGNKVSGGKSNYLYSCAGPGEATEPKKCDYGCVVAPAGTDDYCAPKPVTCDADAKTGYYCAGNHVTGGAANTLYYCSGPGDAEKVQGCSTSCVVAPAGTDDYCQGSTTSSSGYRLPFKCNASYRCSNGNNTSTHTGTDRYAYDFAMPVGTSVRAIRNGVVHRVRIVSKPGSACYSGGGSSCANYANTVEVRHDDGSIALYMHINSASVSTGQRVTQGQEVAKSGNTGWSTGPHLHLQVQSNCGIWWCQSKPFAFAEKSVITSGTTVTSKNNCP